MHKKHDTYGSPDHVLDGEAVAQVAVVGLEQLVPLSLHMWCTGAIATADGTCV